MDGNIITAAFQEGETRCVASGLWQWDFGQILQITGLDLPAAVELHMYQKDLSCTRVGTTENGVTRVAIPDIMLRANMPITIYLYLHVEQTDGETEYKITLPITGRQRPVDYDIADPGISIVYQALLDALDLLNGQIQTVQECAEEAVAAAESASANAILAESYAKGATGSRAGEDTDNAKYYKESIEREYYTFTVIEETGDLEVTIS